MIAVGLTILILFGGVAAFDAACDMWDGWQLRRACRRRNVADAARTVRRVPR